MPSTRMVTTVLLGVVQKIRKSTGFNPGLLLSLCRQRPSATLRVATAVLVVALLVATPVAVSAATPDPVLEWIGVMNNAVIAGGTAPNVTSRIVALVSASVFDAVNGIKPRFRPLRVRPDAPHNASQDAGRFRRPTQFF